MNSARLNLIIAAAIALFFVALGLGAGGGYWLTARHYRPIVASAQDKTTQAGRDLAACTATRGNLEGQVGEQNLAIKGLQEASEKRDAAAKAAAAQAHAEAEADYQAANRIQQDRIGGDPAAAAARIIDRELGL